MARRASLKASDHDREQVAERLRQAAAEGRLLAEELEYRVARALRARTYAELDPLVADLPRQSTRHPRRQLSPLTGIAAAVVVAVAVVAVMAVAVLILTGFAMAWALWVFLAWWFVGRGRRGAYACRHRGPRAQIRVAHRRSLL